MSQFLQKLSLCAVLAFLCPAETCAQMPPVDLIQNNGFESASGFHEIVFVTDQSVILEEIGQTAVISAIILDSAGQSVHLPLSWELESNPLVSLQGANANSALVRLESFGVDSIQLTASNIDLGISNNAQVVLADLSPNAMYVASDTVIRIDHAANMLVLQRNARTETIQIGDVIFSGDMAGVLVRVLDISLSPDQVILTVEPATITDALENAEISSSSPVQKLRVQFDGGKRTLTVTKDSQVIKTSVPTSALDCRREDGSDFGLEVVGGTIDWTYYSSLTPTHSIVGSTVEEFSILVTQSLGLNATTGSLEFSSVLSGTVTCTLEIDPIKTPAVPIYMFSVNLTLNPVVGVQVSGNTSGPSFSIVGPTGSLAGSTTWGIRYRSATGWEPVGSVSWGGVVSPLTADFDTGISFALNANAFGAAGLAIDANLGRWPYYNLASLEFAEVRATANLDAALSSPFDPNERDYTGPIWNARGGLTGSYKAELSGGALSALLKKLDIPTEVPISGNIFDPFEIDVAGSPQINLTVTCNPSCPLNPFALNSADLRATTPGNEHGTVNYLGSLNGAASLIPLVTSPLTDGASTAYWQPGPEDDGTYDVFARVETDALSAVFPYAPSGFETFAVGGSARSYPLHPQASFIRSDPGEPTLDPLVIDLNALGIVPGQVIKLSSFGFFFMGQPPTDEARWINMVFSSSNELLPHDQLHRVPGAVPALVDEFLTGDTCFAEPLPTDIPEDFQVFDPVVVTVPTGAGFLFVGTVDCAYSDNSDPDGDLGVAIEYLPE